MDVIPPKPGGYIHLRLKPRLTLSFLFISLIKTLIDFPQSQAWTRRSASWSKKHPFFLSPAPFTIPSFWITFQRTFNFRKQSWKTADLSYCLAA